MTTDQRTGSALRRTSDRVDERALQGPEFTQNLEISDEMRLAEFRAAQSQASLPNIPEIQGFHVCWLTTSDGSIPNKLRLGYRPVEESDIPGWYFATEKSAVLPGWIGVNEMVAAKIPLTLYQAYFNEVHVKAPQAEEDRMRAVLDAIKEQAARSGARTIEGDELI